MEKLKVINLLSILVLIFSCSSNQKQLIPYPNKEISLGDNLTSINNKFGREIIRNRSIPPVNHCGITELSFKDVVCIEDNVCVEFNNTIFIKNGIVILFSMYAIDLSNDQKKMLMNFFDKKIIKESLTKHVKEKILTEHYYYDNYFAYSISYKGVDLEIENCD